MNGLRISSFLVAIGLSLCSFAEEDSAKIYIPVGEAQVKKSVLAIPPMINLGTPGIERDTISVQEEMRRVLLNNLEVSGLFQIAAPSSIPTEIARLPLDAKPGEGLALGPLRTAGIEFLARTFLSIQKNDLVLDVRVFQISSGDLVLGQRYRGSRDASRRMIHTMCNDLLKALTGQTGMFLSRITFASNRNAGKSREIWVSDWDGENAVRITNHRSIALSPAWSPDGNRVAYTAFVQRARSRIRNADLFIFDLSTGKRTPFSYRVGMNSGAAFLPGNQGLLLTLTRDDNPDIYHLDKDGEIVKRITNGPRSAMNVEPAVSPDGKQIAFSSDRHGNTMIYVMNIDGSNVRRITFAGKFNSTPAWSPDGKRLAFSAWTDKNFDVYTVNVDGSDMKRITDAKKPNGRQARSEDPVFSPDGRHLMYTSDRTGKNQIYISDLTGKVERPITKDNSEYFKPKWSINID